MPTVSETIASEIDFAALARQIKAWGVELGFAKVGITGVDLRDDETHLQEWLRQGRHGTMDYMQHGVDTDAAWRTLGDGECAYISRYALGRDYHKLIRNRLQKLADRIA